MAPRAEDIDRAAGTRLGALWFLPAFGVVLPGVVVLASHDISRGTRWFWLVAGAICWASFVWAWAERGRARRFVRRLHEQGEDLQAGGLEHEGARLTSRSTLVQYEVRISLLVIEIALLTAPRVNGRALVPNLITLLLGWWAIPWGPIHTVRTVWQNAHGGHTRTVAELLGALSRPAQPKASWWRRALALDTGDNVKSILNVAVALFLLAFGGLIAFAIVAAYLHPAG